MILFFVINPKIELMDSDQMMKELEEIDRQMEGFIFNFFL
jgi:hypothetical protein